jgi:predicted XRE-type DNA-binding protein
MTPSYFETKNIAQLCKLLEVPPTEAPKIKMRLDIIKGINKKIEKSGMTHSDAASAAHVGRSLITAIMNGNLDKVSTDRLIHVALALGVKMSLKVQ